MSRGSKTKYRKTAWTAVWARHWSARNRFRKTRGLKKTMHRMCRDGIIWPFRIHLSCYLKLRNKIAERIVSVFAVTYCNICRTVPHWYLLIGWYLVRSAFLVWIIREKIGDNPHWKSDSIDNKCVTKLAVARSRPTSGQNSSMYFTKQRKKNNLPQIRRRFP